MHSVKSISRALAGVRASPVMVPMLQSFEAGPSCGGAAAADGAALDAVITIHGIDDEVPSSCTAPCVPMHCARGSSAMRSTAVSHRR